MPSTLATTLSSTGLGNSFVAVFVCGLFWSISPDARLYAIFLSLLFSSF